MEMNARNDESFELEADNPLSKHINFYWEVIEHDSKQIKIKFDFENTEFVSSSILGYDQIKIQFKQIHLFKSLENGKPILRYAKVFKQEN